MRLRAFSLTETMVALSIMAFVSAASVHQLAGLYARSKSNLGKAYMLMKTLEHAPASADRLLEAGPYRAEVTETPREPGLWEVTLRAHMVSGRHLITIRKLVRHGEGE